MKLEIQVEIPDVPNHIRVGEILIDVAELTDKQVEEIGQEWTKHLMDNRNKRKQK